MDGWMGKGNPLNYGLTKPKAPSYIMAGFSFPCGVRGLLPAGLQFTTSTHQSYPCFTAGCLHPLCWLQSLCNPSLSFPGLRSLSPPLSYLGIRHHSLGAIRLVSAVSKATCMVLPLILP